MTAVANPAQPIQFGNNAGSSGVTLTFSGGSTGTNFYRKPGGYQPFRPTPGANYSQEILMGDGPGRRLRKNVANVRRHVDYVSNILNHADARLWQYGYGRKTRLIQQPDELYQNTALPTWCTPDVPVDCVLTKFVRAAMNKVKCPIYTVCWSPEGKRLVTGASTGEFTLWNGTAFNFETILQAHDSAIRAMTWSYNEQWLVSADHEGYIKYWQPNMNNVHMFQAHKDDPIRGLSFAPTDVKFVSAADDGTARVWDFARCTEERVLRGHGSEVRCVDWHPAKGLIVTGSRDSQQPVKLWDPKTGLCLSTLQDHKSSVMAVEWNRNGNWLLTAGRDHLIKLYDIRIMKEMHTFRGHKKEVTSVAWNPVHENLFVSGGGDGSLAYWLVGNEKEVGLLEHAHDQAVWSMKFHPKGHILSTGSNDNNTKFWARNRPGDTQEDIFGLASFTTNMVGALDKEREPRAAPVRIEEDAPLATTVIPGMGLDEDVYENMNREISTGSSAASSAQLLIPEDLNSRQQAATLNARRVLIKQPPPKKAQRQFERMWNVSKPGGAGDEPPIEDDTYRRPKASLLGNPPPQASMLGKQGPTQNAAGALPPPPFVPPMPPGWKPGQPLPMPPKLTPTPPSQQTPQQQGQAGKAPPPQRPPGYPPPSMTRSGLGPQSVGGRPPFGFPPGMPPMVPGMWPPPPGMLPPGMPPISPAGQKKTNIDPPKEAEATDIDYRTVPSAARQPAAAESDRSLSGGDVDLRQQMRQTQQQQPSKQQQQQQQQKSAEPWRQQEAQVASMMQKPPPTVVHDPRMRKPPQEEIRDPRRRMQQQDGVENGSRASTQQQDPRNNWMPQISNYSSQKQAQDRDQRNYNNSSEYGGSADGDYREGYASQDGSYGRKQYDSYQDGSNNGHGPMRGHQQDRSGGRGQWRGRGRGRPY